MTEHRTNIELSEDMIEQVINDCIRETGRAPGEMTGSEFADRLLAKMRVTTDADKA
jgi:hypothetical protein